MELFTKEQIITLLSAIIGLISGVVLQIILTEPIHYLIATRFSFLIPSSRRKLNGIWKTKYNYETDSKQLEEYQLFKIRQFGSYIFGKNLTAKDHWYTISGRLENDTFLTGKWKNVLENDIYHGAFQFFVPPIGDKMIGKWIGFNKRNKIKSGKWKWRKIIDNSSRSEIAKIINDSNKKHFFDDLAK